MVMPSLSIPPKQFLVFISLTVMPTTANTSMPFNSNCLCIASEASSAILFFFFFFDINITPSHEQMNVNIYAYIILNKKHHETFKLIHGVIRRSCMLQIFSLASEDLLHDL